MATQTFGLTYIGEDGSEHPVYVIHRAPLGSHERFTAFLIEHYAGAFPTWLAPTQVRIVPITEKVTDYAHKVRDEIFNTPVVNGTSGLRVDIDLSNERMQKKIREAQLQKIPYMLVIGEREAAEGKVAVRLRSGKDLGAMPLETFIARIKREAESRRDVAE
jgi:threonyl-tRNA synthetase